MRTIAIIPARSGSKGLKDKNIKELCEKPLMAYAIENALKCQYIDCVMVSTDSEKYAEIAQKYGAEVPFLRSELLASDTAKTLDVIYEVIDEYEKRGEKFDVVVLLQPTSPLCTTHNLNEAFEMLYNRKADSIVSVCECEHSPLLSNVLGADLNLHHFVKDYSDTRRQDMSTFYRLNGAIYISKIERLKQMKSFYGEKSYAYIMKTEESVDIDSEIDFVIAEALLKRRSKFKTKR